MSFNIYDRSSADDCGTMKQSIRSHWIKYYPQGSCSTTAQLQTIEGALNKALRSTDGVCTTTCLKLDHGGAWAGYLVIGQNQADVENAPCGSDETYSTCRSGGNNDLPKGISKDTGHYSS